MRISSAAHACSEFWTHPVDVCYIPLHTGGHLYCASVSVSFSNVSKQVSPNTCNRRQNASAAPGGIRHSSFIKISFQLPFERVHGCDKLSSHRTDGRLLLTVDPDKVKLCCRASVFTLGSWIHPSSRCWQTVAGSVDSYRWRNLWC